jgi:hypothetical protein
MNAFAILLLAIPALCAATTVEHREIADLRARERQLQAAIAEIRWLYRDDRTFIAAFDTAQKKWDEYCSAMLEARFPAKKKQEEYGSVFELAYAVTKLGLMEARLKDLALWTEGTEEGDVSKGSVKLKSELDEIRRQEKGG